MRCLEVIVVILVAVPAMAWLARRLRWNEPVLLVAGGCLIGLTPEFRTPALPSPVVLLLFLPPLLYWGSLTTSLREIRTNLRGIVLLSTGLVLATAAAVAGVGHALGLAWPLAFALGAVVAPTDGIAVQAVARLLPRGIRTVLRAESLINDGTALRGGRGGRGSRTGRHLAGDRRTFPAGLRGRGRDRRRLRRRRGGTAQAVA